MQATILILCEDQTGIISAVTGFIHKHGGNIIYLDQHVDQQVGKFFMRIESDFNDPFDSSEDFEKAFSEELAKPYGMKWGFYTAAVKPKMALFVSKYNHCLYDLLSRFKSGELPVAIPFILSNHQELEYVAKQFDIPFYWVPGSKRKEIPGRRKTVGVASGTQNRFYSPGPLHANHHAKNNRSFSQ